MDAKAVVPVPSMVLVSHGGRKKMLWIATSKWASCDVDGHWGGCVAEANEGEIMGCGTKDSRTVAFQVMLNVAGVISTCGHGEDGEDGCWGFGSGTTLLEHQQIFAWQGGLLLCGHQT
eukprot:7014987-Ditylum_brightwellii.AAC.1